MSMLVHNGSPSFGILLVKSLRIFVRAGEAWCGGGTLLLASRLTAQQ